MNRSVDQRITITIVGETQAAAADNTQRAEEQLAQMLRSEANHLIVLASDRGDVRKRINVRVLNVVLNQ